MHATHRSLEQKEQQLTDKGKQIDQAENGQRLLKEKLSELKHSSQLASMEIVKLAKKKEELEI